jgi:AraC family transcriptional regulator
MLSLQKGAYLASLDKTICEDHLIASLTSYPEVERYDKMHYHENAHISFVLSGGNLERRKNYEIERLPGKITFYYSGEYHQSTNIMNFSSHINLELEQQFLKEFDVDESDLDTAIKNSPDAKFLLLQVHREFAANDDSSAISIRMLLLDLLDHSLYFQEKLKSHAWVDKMEQILRSNWDQHLSLKDLATSLNMHPVTVSRQFHKYYHCTLGEYVRKLKIEKALSLIKTSTQSLTGIAFECGFADQSHFTRTFKRLTGFLPHVYQKL